MSKILLPGIVIEIICFAFACFALAKDKRIFWRLMIVYMGLTAGVEFGGRIMAVVYHQHNAWLYDIYVLFQCFALSYCFFTLLKRYIANAKPIMIIGLAIMLITYSLEAYYGGFDRYFSFTVNVYSVIFILYILYYFYLLLKDDSFIQLNIHPEFWWVVGLLFFLFGGTVINLFAENFNVKITAKHGLRYYIYMVLIYILYSFWIYAFICRARQRKSQPLS